MAIGYSILKVIEVYIRCWGSKQIVVGGGHNILEILDAYVICDSSLHTVSFQP